VLSSGVLAGAYTLGVLLGTLAARGAEESSLSQTLEDCLWAVQNGQVTADWLPLLWSCVRLPALVFLSGFSVLGLVVIPAVMGIEGFTLAYSVAAFLRIYGGEGCGAAAIAFGLGGGLALMALVLLGTQGFGAAGQLLVRLKTGRRGLVYTETYWRNCLLAALLVVIQLLTEKFAVLPLLAAAIGKLCA
jgi:hypothetical protein